jgi:hypothetical protein
MKNISLALFAALILLGWTSLAAGVIAVFAGDPQFSSHVKAPVQQQAPELGPQDLAPMYSGAPCPTDQKPDASVPCEA